MIRAFLSQSILHALVAALLVEALLAVWKTTDAAWRLRCRLLALQAPLLWLPLLFLIAPFRRSPFFVARVALFAGERWNLVSVGGQGLGDLLLVLAAGAGSALFLRDGLPVVRDLLRRPAAPAPAPWEPTGSTVAGIAARHAAALGVSAPDVSVVRATRPVLLCEGGRRVSLVVSPATLTALDAEALDAAVAHEVAHGAFRDPAWGYVLMAARALLFFNPAAQWLARTIVDDVEQRADQAAVRLTGRTEPLARAIARLFDGQYPPPGDSASFERVFWQVRRAGMSRRCDRLREIGAAPRAAHGTLQLVLAAAAVLGLLIFVV